MKGQWQAAELQMNVEKILSHMSVSVNSFYFQSINNQIILNP